MEDDDFSFGTLNISVKMKEQDKIVSDIVLSSFRTEKDDKHLLFLLEKPFKGAVLGAISTFLRKNFPGYSYDVATASILDVSEEDIKKEGIFRHYRRAQSDFKKLIIPDKTIVVTFGMAINAITLSSDLSVECFHDFVFNKTYFFSPETDTMVFPIDSVYSLFTDEAGFWAPKDCSRVQFALHQFQQIKTHYNSIKVPEPYVVPRIITVGTKEEWKKFYNAFKDVSGELAWDTETTGLDFIRDYLGCFTCSFDGKTGYYIPWDVINVEELNLILKNKIQIFQNGKFDRKFANRNKVHQAKINHDTLVMAHQLNEMRFNSLKSLAYYYTPYGGYDMALEDYKDRYSPESYMDIPEPILKQYATMDPIVCMISYKKMKEQMKGIDKNFPPIHENGWELERLYSTIRIPALNTFSEIETRGVCVNMDIWERNSRILQDKINLIKAPLNAFFGVKEDSIFEDLLQDPLEEFDETPTKKSTLQSTMKLGKLLEEKGWENLGRAKNGVYLTGDDQLVRWAKTHEEAKELQKLRSYLTLQKTFMGTPGSSTTGWKRYVISHPDGTYRIHPSYKVMMMDTFRNGCSDPNYQQVPSGALDAYLFKEIFTTPDPEKYLLVTLDYSGFQLHLASLDIGDSNDFLYKKYLKDPNVDLHSVTGFNVFSKDVEYIFVDQDEHSFCFLPMEKVMTSRGLIRAEELKESDTLIIEEEH